MLEMRWLELISSVALLGGSGVCFGLVAVHAYHRAGLTALLALWLSASIVWGYLSYRRFCSHPLTCDVGGLDYWPSLVPGFSVIAAVTLACAGGVMIWGSIRRSDRGLNLREYRPWHVGAVATVAIGAWLVASYLVLDRQGWPRLGL